MELFWSQISWSEAVQWYTQLNADPYTSLERLPLAISIKITIIEIIASAWGTSISGGTRLHFLSSPLHHPLHTFLFPSPQSPHDTKRSLRRSEPLYYTSSRLIAHSEDPDIDKPYQPPTGHVLGASKWFFFYLFWLSSVIQVSILLVNVTTHFSHEFYFLALEGDTTTLDAEGGSEKTPVENSELSSNSADAIEQPQQALSLVCDE